MAAHLWQELVSPSDINPEISRKFSDVVMRALAKDRRQRWQTAHEFLQALEGADLGKARDTRVFTQPAPVGSGALAASVGVAQASGTPPRASGPSGQYAPEQLNEIALKLANYVGPIANILVKRASNGTQDLRTLVEQVSLEIDSEDARRKFLASVQPQIRGRNFFAN